MKWKLPIGLAAVAAAGAVVYVSGYNLSHARTAWAKFVATEETPANTEPLKTRPPFDGVIKLTPREYQSIGVNLAKVEPQTAPLLLDISSKTEYDPNTQSRVRPKFRSKIDKVYVNLGQSVKEGDPLVDVFSGELAKAKGEYEKAMAQWDRDKLELHRTKELTKTNAASEKDLVQDESDEKQSAVAASFAKDLLFFLGLTEAEIAKVPKEDGLQKARMTLHAPASGVVIERDLVQGNIYDDNDTLLVIAPLDHFWVRGYVYPSDANRVSLGQDWVIHCPTVASDYRRKVESITSEIDPESKTIRIRTQIDNPQNRIKANMLLRSQLEIPPVPGNSVIPRLAMISSDGGNYAYVHRPARSDSNGIEQFERRRIKVAQENTDSVIVTLGLNPGEEVATRGSLILDQIYEDSTALDGVHEVATP